MEMKNFITKGSLGLASMLICAAPAFSSPIITMNFGLPGFTAAGISTSGSTVTKFGATINSGTLGGFAESGLTLTDVANVWTLAGTWDGITSASLLTFTNTPTVSGTVATYGGTTQLTSLNSSLATALGLPTTGDELVLNSGSLNFTGGTANPVVNGVSYQTTVVSPTLLLTLSTPEPASFFLMGSALLMVGMMFKNRRIAAVKPLA